MKFPTHSPLGDDRVDVARKHARSRIRQHRSASEGRMAAAAGSMQELRDQARQARHEAEMRLLGMTAVTGGADDLEKEAARRKTLMSSNEFNAMLLQQKHTPSQKKLEIRRIQAGEMEKRIRSMKRSLNNRQWYDGKTLYDSQHGSKESDPTKPEDVLEEVFDWAKDVPKPAPAAEDPPAKPSKAPPKAPPSMPPEPKVPSAAAAALAAMASSDQDFRTPLATAPVSHGVAAAPLSQPMPSGPPPPPLGGYAAAAPWPGQMVMPYAYAPPGAYAAAPPPPPVFHGREDGRSSSHHRGGGHHKTRRSKHKHDREERRQRRSRTKEGGERASDAETKEKGADAKASPDSSKAEDVKPANGISQHAKQIASVVSE